MRSIKIPAILALFTLAALAGNVRAEDPRIPDYQFKYSLYNPGGFSVKKSKFQLRYDPKVPKGTVCLLDKDGKFVPGAMWYYKIGSDPESFKTWWLGYLSDPNVWHQSESPVWKGTAAGNQGHRIIAWIHVLKELMAKDPGIDQNVKDAFMSDAWAREVEKIIGSTFDKEKGWITYAGNTPDMACMFHFIRSKFGAMDLHMDNFITIEIAQNMVCTLLTEKWIINPEDAYLDPPSQEFLEKIGAQKGGETKDIRIVKDGKILYTGGLFIGWKNQASLHGTWDGLSILNALFKYYPEPDPASPKSIYYKWNKLPEEKKAIAKKTMTTLSRRLWLDWKENKGPTWCWVRNGVPVNEDSLPSEAPFLPAYDGYGDNQLGWAKVCWEEIYGDPMRGTSDGTNALLAIVHGKVLPKLTMPVGQQVPYRYHYSKEGQAKALEEDLKMLEDPAHQKMIKEKYGLTVEEAKARINKYITDLALPPGQQKTDEAPKLDPKKEGAKTTNEAG